MISAGFSNNGSPVQMILAINTSTLQFSAALLNEDGSLLAEYVMFPESGHFGRFMPAIDGLIKSVNGEIKDIKAVAIAKGPGSFTGLRVGLAAAKGMCQGMDIPIIGIPTLDALACQLSHISLPLCVITDSRRNEVFSALFHWKNKEGMVRVSEDASILIKDIHTIVSVPSIIIGNNFEKQSGIISEVLGNKAHLAPASLWNLRASSLGIKALERFRSKNFDVLDELVPAYMRSPDIRPNPNINKT